MEKFKEGDIVVINHFALVFKVRTFPDGDEGIISDGIGYFDGENYYEVRIKDKTGLSKDGFESYLYTLPETALMLKSEAEAIQRKVDRNKKFSIGDLVIVVPHEPRPDRVLKPHKNHFGKRGLVSAIKSYNGKDIRYQVRLECDENLMGAQNVLEDGFQKYGHHFYEEGLILASEIKD